MDVRTQDAVERMVRDGKAADFFAYIHGRRLEYMESLTNYDPSDVVSMARTQGMVQAFAEVLRIPDEAQNLKDTRTS